MDRSFLRPEATPRGARPVERGRRAGQLAGAGGRRRGHRTRRAAAAAARPRLRARSGLPLRAPDGVRAHARLPGGQAVAARRAISRAPRRRPRPMSPSGRGGPRERRGERRAPARSGGERPAAQPRLPAAVRRPLRLAARRRGLPGGAGLAGVHALGRADRAVAAGNRDDGAADRAAAARRGGQRPLRPPARDAVRRPRARGAAGAARARWRPAGRCVCGR